MRKHPIIAGCAIIFGVVLITLVILVSVFAPGYKQSTVAFLPGSKVAVVEIKGIILESRDILTTLEDYRKNRNVKAMVVRIDSPGGAVGPSQEIYSTIADIDKEKPVIASMGAVAASGGYYIALGARKILANPGTITGSIGVIMEISNLKELMKWAKIDQEVIKSGKYKDLGSPFRSLTEKERKKLQNFVDQVHEQFVRAVEKSRDLSHDQVLKIADGMIFSGEKAVSLGLIDRIGTLKNAIELAAEEAGIEGEPEVVYPSPPSVWRQLARGEFSMTDMFRGTIPPEGVRAMYLMRP